MVALAAGLAGGIALETNEQARGVDWHHRDMIADGWRPPGTDEPIQPGTETAVLVAEQDQQKSLLS